MEEACRLNAPALVVSGGFRATKRIIRVEETAPDATGVQIDAVKKAEDGDCLIVRMHECRGGRRRVRISSDYPVERIVPCNLLEHDLATEGAPGCEAGAEAKAGAETGAVLGEREQGYAPVSAGTAELIFHPFEIKTLKIYMKK